jgi:hypothetical protein
MTNKSSLIEHIAQLARESSLEGIADLRDESDRHGLRIVVELTRTAEPEKVLQDLYKRTAMRSTFGIIMLALVDGEPRMLSLKQALRVYLDHRLVVIRRRGEYELEKARSRLHILEGLRVALKHLDEIIELIKKAPDADIARDRLMKRYRLSEIQAQAILDMQLRRLAALERKKIEDEYKELLAQIKLLEGLLRSPLKMRQTVATELLQVKEAYGDRRRTQITRLGAGAKSVLPVMTATDLLPEQTVWVSATTDGLVSRTLDEKPPRISGTAAPRFLLQVNTRDTLFLVSERGEAAGIPVQTLPEAASPQDGAPLHKVSALSEVDKLAALFTLPPKEERLEGWFVFTATLQGMLKKTSLEELPGPTGHSFTLVKVNDDDKLGWLRLTDGQAEILLVTADGMAIRFHEDAVRSMGLVAAGVGGIKLGARDLVIGLELIPRRGEILLVTSDGRAKRVTPDQFPRQGRYGQGVIAWKLPRTSQLVGVAAGKPNTRLTLLLDKLSPKAMRFDDAPLQTRIATGKSVIDLKAGYQVLGLSIPWAVPRAVVGEKPTLEKELEVPDEAEEGAAPSVEQLSFGMDEQPSQAAPLGGKPKKPKPLAQPKANKKPARRKSKASQAGQAALITKPIASQKKSLAAKPALPAISKVKPAGDRKSPAKSSHVKAATSSGHSADKLQTVPGSRTKSRPKTPKKNKGNSVQKATSPRIIKTSPSPAGKVVKPTSKKVAANSNKTPAKITKKLVKPKPSAKVTAKPSKNIVSSPSAKASAKLAPKVSTKPTSKPKTKPAAKSAAKPSPTAGSKKPTGRKPPQIKMTVKSVETTSRVILPHSWKPTSKKNPSIRSRSKSQKPKP